MDTLAVKMTADLGMEIFMDATIAVTGSPTRCGSTAATDLCWGVMLGCAAVVEPNPTAEFGRASLEMRDCTNAHK